MILRALLVGATLALAAAACGGDSRTDTTTTGPADTGVTFPDTVPLPEGGASSTTTTTDEADGVEVTDGEPDGFPDDFPRPDEAEVQFGSTRVVGEDEVSSVDLTVEDDFAAVTGFYRNELSDSDLALLFDDIDADARQPTANFRFETDAYLGDVLVLVVDGEVTVTLTATRPRD